jgi:hypothetical protein
MKNNRIEVVEVVLGAKEALSKEAMDDVYNGINEQLSRTNQPDEVVEFVNEKLNDWYNNPSDKNYKSLYAALGEVNLSLDDFIESAEDRMDDTKFSQYQLEGEKENYKEVLVTLSKRVIPNERIYEVRKLEDGYSVFNTKTNKFESLTGIVSEQEAQKRVDSANNLGDNRFEDTKFQSSHFPQKDILVHLRMNTRTDSDGNKILFLEEVQSDWGQKGKREGFVGELEYDKADKAYGEFIKEMELKYGKGRWQYEMDESESRKEYDLLDIRDRAESRDRSKIPSAPFVTDTNSWTKLGLKTALKEAVAQGADKLAWTTGEQQNERYDLSKQVDEIQYFDRGNEVYSIVGIKDGSHLFSEIVQSDKLEASLGKDVAQRILNNEGGKGVGGGKVLKGKDLSVGGKGMKGFYGSPTEGNLGIVGNVAKSLFGKEPKTTDIIIREREAKDPAYWDGENYIGTFNGVAKKFDSLEDANKYVNLAKKEYDTTTQYSIDITPELKQAVKEGIPLFKSELTQAKERLKEASAALSKLNKNLSIYSDPEQNARALFEYHKALVGLAKAYIKQIVKSGLANIKPDIKEFAAEIGESVTQEIQDAWNEANGKSKKTLSDFKDAAEKIQAKEEKERLAGKAKRMTPQRLLASSEYSDEFKQAIGEDIIYYSVLPKRVTEQEAQAIIDLKGNENAEIAIMDMNNGIPMAVRNKIAQKLIDNYEAEGNIEKAVDIFAKITEKITDSAQGLSSLSTWPRLSPAANVYMAKQSIKKQRDKRASNSKNTTDKIDKEFKKVNKDSIEEALENIKNIVERNSLPNAGATVTELPAGYGQNNKVFTRDKYLAAKKKLRGATFSFAGGVPIEELIDIAGYHIEATGKDFNKFTRRMKADLGNKIKPYLKDIYAKTRKQLIDSGYDKDLFLSDEDVDAQIAEQEGSVFLEKLKKAIEKKDEKAAKAAIAKLQEISKEDGLWGQYKQSAANRLKNVVVTNIQKDISENPSLEQFTDSLVKNMRLKMAELLPEVTNKKAIQRPDIEVIGDAFKNFEKYKEVWEQTQNEFQEKYQDFPEILEAIDAYFGEILDKPFSDKLLTRSINKGLKEMGVVVNDIVTKHYTVVDNTKQTLVDKLINDAGLTGAEAQTLAKAIEKEFDRIATEKKSKILAKIFSRKERKKPEVRSMESDIIRMTNLGAFRSDDIVQLYGDKMGWPKLTEANIKEIERLATIVQKTEDPIKKRKAVEDLLAYQANIKGVSVLDVATAIWYANILSGYNTQFVNFGSNAINTALLYGGVIAQNPRDAKFITKGLINGIKRGLLEGKEVLRTGYSPIKGKAEIPSLLERANFKDAIKGLPLPFVKSLDYASKLKYVRRIMVAADVIFFEGLKEMRAYQIAAIQAANEGKEKPTINQLNRAIELVGLSDEQYQAAREKAQLEYEQEVDAINSKELSEKNKKEALNQAEIDRRRRIYDLIEQNRSFNIIDESAEYAAEGTYNYPPKGGLGLAANALNTMVSGVPVLRYAIPFTNIIANVANETINYTPLAFARLKKGGFTNFRREALTQQQRTDLLYKGIIGTTLMAATFALTQIKGDDDEPILEITANGTGDYVKNATLQETGWQPYSIRFKLPNGEYSGWMSYQYSPLIAALGYIGNINDMMRYGDADEETIVSLMSKSAGMTTSTFFQSTFLDGLGDLLSTVLDSRNIQKQQSIVEKLLGAGAGAVKALLIPNLFNQTSQAVQKITGEYKKETTKNVTGKFLQDIPYARDMFFDKINILGDPISPDTDKFLSFGKPNKAIELLVKNKQVFGPISREGEKIYDIVKDKERALTDEEFFTFSKEKGQYIKKELLDNYDDYSKMSEKEFKKQMTKIKKDATEKARESIGKISPDIEIMTIDNIEYKLTPDKVAERKDYIQEYIDDKEDSRSFERKIEKLIEKGSIKDTPSEIKKILMSDAKEYATKKMKKDYEDNPEELGAVKD